MPAWSPRWARPPAKPKQPLPPGPDGRAPSKLVRSPHYRDTVWTRKGGRYHFGYKAHVGVDKLSGLIRRVLLTDASVNDTVPADDLVCSDEAPANLDCATRDVRRTRSS